MRIALVSYDFDPPIGGMGAVAKIVTDEIERSHPADTFVAISASPNADERIGGTRWNKGLGCPLFSLLLAFQLNRILRKHSIDRVHAHAGSGGVFLLFRPSVPLLVTAHHTYYQEVRLVFKGRLLKQFLKWLMSLLERRTYRLADRIVAVSQDTKDALVNDYGVQAAKITVIENPIVEVPASSHTRSENVILSVGRLEPRKGTETLLRAFAIAHAKNHDLRLRLVGKNMMGDSLALLLSSLKISDVVTVLGHVNEETMQRELLSAGMLVVPSLLEGFGLIAAQGMMMGTCVIVTDVPGLKSLVADGRTGLVVSSDNPEELASAMQRVHGDAALRERFGKEAMNEARARFSIRNRAEDLYDEYKRL